MKHKIILWIFISILCLSGCRSDKATEKTIYAMDTVMMLKAYGENSEKAVTEAVDMINIADENFDRGDIKSDVYKINHERTAKVSTQTSQIFKAASEISEMTDGRFDITIAPIVDLWGFYTKDFYVPDENEINKNLSRVNYKNVSVSGQDICLKENSEVDLGAIAKGFVSDKITDIFKENGIRSAIVSLGGNVQTMGTRPDGQKWNVAVEHPDKDKEYAGTLKVENMAVVTSGSYQRYFERDTKIYHHIIDPKTGKPANNGLTSVTVVTESGTLADALSTAVFVMGFDKGIEFWHENENFELIFVTENGEIYITEGLNGVFASEFEYKVIKR